MDNSRKKLRLGDVLVNSGVISEEQLQKGLELQKGSGRKLGETLVDEGLVSEENITNALSSQLNLDVIDLQNVTVSEDILSLVPANILKKYKILPFGGEHEYPACGNGGPDGYDGDGRYYHHNQFAGRARCVHDKKHYARAG